MAETTTVTEYRVTYQGKPGEEDVFTTRVALRDWLGVCADAKRARVQQRRVHTTVSMSPWEDADEFQPGESK